MVDLIVGSYGGWKRCLGEASPPRLPLSVFITGAVGFINSHGPRLRLAAHQIKLCYDYCTCLFSSYVNFAVWVVGCGCVLVGEMRGINIGGVWGRKEKRGGQFIVTSREVLRNDSIPSIFKNYTLFPHFLKGRVHIKDKNLPWKNGMPFLKYEDIVIL